MRGRAQGRPPHRTDNAPNGDGIYGPDGVGPIRFRRSEPFDLHLMIFGDSTAAGLGAEVADETPGVQITRRLAAETGRVVALAVGLDVLLNPILIAGWGTEECAIGRILSDILLGNGIDEDDGFVECRYPEMLSYDPESDGDLDGEIPF